MEIKGLTKTTLLDYPGHVAATVFTGGCDFKCPYCYNKSLVLHPQRLPSIPVEDIYAFLESRKNALEGICITGGEPLIQEDLCAFLYTVKMMGFKVKLDTNGSDPTHLSHILENHLVDYVSMDIKNSLQKYATTAGISTLDLNRIKLSADLLMDSDIDYEFRTTVVKELHQPEDFEAIGEWLKGAKVYYLQSYVDSKDVIVPVFSNYDQQGMQNIQKILSRSIEHVYIRVNNH